MKPTNNQHTTRIAVVGVGNVGTSAAYALTLGGIAEDLLLVDIRASVRDSLVRDLSDVAHGIKSRTRVRAATYQEVGQCDIVVLTPGSERSPGETRVQHMYKQVAIVQSIVNQTRPFRSDTVLVVATSPVDLLCSIAQELSGLPTCQVLGSGTFFDSLQLCRLLAEKARVAAQSVDVNVLGVRGESQVVAWSCGKIGGLPLASHFPDDTKDHDQVWGECKYRPPTIIRTKGITSFGFGSTVSNICSIILFNKREVCSISHYQPEFGCCISWPVILGRSGVIKKVDMPLNGEEEASISKSIKALREQIARVKEDL